jgi:pimeloyl-ACP methyl ester carboxylesterase
MSKRMEVIKVRNKKSQELLGRKNKDSRVQKPPCKRRKSKLVIALFSIVGVIFVGLLVILINSPGKLPPLKDEQGKVIPGSISEKLWIEVNGIKQGMFIRGENPENPVVLYLHGGPGEPMLQFMSAVEETEKSERLEKYFTVCYWDQRGSGMTYSKSTDPSTMTLEQMVEDTRVVTEYLQSRFGQDKIYLIGQSWGTFLGVKTIEKYPENYLAYAGIGQAVNTVESERLAYDYMLNHAKKINDKKAIEELEKYDMSSFPWFDKDDFSWLFYLGKTRTKILNEYGVGRMHQGVSFSDMLRAFFMFKGYTLREKINWFIGEDFSIVRLFPICLNDDLAVSSVEFEVPFYIVHGGLDYVTSLVIAENYFDIVKAPKKEFFLFENSAHSPNLEEPEKFVEIFRKIASENH